MTKLQPPSGGLDRRTLLRRGLVLGGVTGAGMLANVPGGGAGSSAAATPRVVVPTLTGAAIQTAIDALPPSGGTVQLVDGTYAVSTSLKIRNNCALVGASRSGTILQVAPKANATVLVNVDPVNGNSNLAVRSLTIDGNRANQNGAIASKGIELHRCANIVLDDLDVHHCTATGIVLSGDGTVTRVGRLSNIYAHHNGYNGIFTYWAMREITYTGLICDLNDNDGLDIGNSEAIVSGVQCNRNGRDGFRVDSVMANNLTGLTANLNGRYGIALLALINSVGAGWSAHDNGQKTAASDVFFDDNTLTYGPSDHVVVSGIDCGAVQVSTWGPPWPPPTPPTETYGLAFGPTVAGNIALLGVRNSGGKLGQYSLPASSPSSRLLIVDHAIGTANFRLLRGNLEIAGGDIRHGAGGRVGFYGCAPAPKPTVTGARGANSALSSVIAALTALGLITDNTS